MKWFIILTFVGGFLTQNVIPLKVDGRSSNLKWLFGLNDKSTEIEKETRTVCNTQECQKIAKIIRENINKSVNPCEDFYEYACGNWPKSMPVSKTASEWNFLYIASISAFKKILEILKTKPKNDDLLTMKLAKQWFKSCTDIKAADKQGLAPLVITLSRIGGWPMVMEPDEWNEQEYSWQKVDNQYMRLTGRNSFYNVHVDYSQSESQEETRIVNIKPPHFSSNVRKLMPQKEDKTQNTNNEGSESEENPSDEQRNSQEFGSEGENHSKDNENDYVNNNEHDWSEDIGNSDIDDDDDDDNDDDDNNYYDYSYYDDDDDEDSDEDDSDDETNEQDKDVKKKLGKKNSTNKVGHKKNRKLDYNRKKWNNTWIPKKHNSHRMRNHRVKKRTESKRVDSKRSQRFIHHRKSNARQHNKVHVKKERKERKKKTVHNTEIMSTTPRDSMKETNNEGEVTKRQEYADYISKVARAIAKERGIEISKEHLDKDIEDMIEFQMKLIEITQKDMEKKTMTLNDFQEWCNEQKPETDNGKIDWVYKVAELFDEASEPIDADLSLLVSLPDYFKALVSLLDETPSRTIVNYIHWNFINRIIKTTTSEMRGMYFKWEFPEKTAETLTDRIISCTTEVEMTNILAYEYVKKYVPDNITKIGLDMLDDIQKEAEYQIKESDWMDEDTKDLLLSKLINMNKLIGYPNWYKNSTIIKRYFQGLIIGNSYYENALNYRRYTKWKNLRKLTREEDEEMQITTVLKIDPAEVNAFYHIQLNFLVITAADFQSPIFAYDRPQFLNFALIGFIMAHEVNHGFDNTGYAYDKNGENTQWISAMAEAYSKRAECFVEQFNNYNIDEETNLKLKDYGNQTIGDNIADTMGLQTVYRAYQRRERECDKPDIVLPGLEEYSTDQLFFLTYASQWCEAMDSENVIEKAKDDEHSTNRLRIIGSVSNSEDFAKVYNCPVGSPMNPKKKCNIWK